MLPHQGMVMGFVRANWCSCNRMVHQKVAGKWGVADEAGQFVRDRVPMGRERGETSATGHTSHAARLSWT